MRSPKAPAAPDPAATAAAQTGTNVSTALANAHLQNVNQVTPDGSLTYAVTGSQKFRDPTSGAEYDIPTYTATTQLSQQQQAIKGQSDAAELNLATTANQQSKFLEEYLGKQVDTSGLPGVKYGAEGEFGTERKAVEDAMYARLNPQIEQTRAAEETRLQNQGIRIGSTAWESAMSDFNRGVNDQRTAITLAGGQEQSRLVGLNNQGRSQAISEMFAQRNQPINEISALLGGSQVQNPQFQSTNMPGIPTVDYAGLVQQNYQNRLGVYQQQQAGRQSMLGGLFGLGSAAIMASDRRMKTDIEPMGDDPDTGVPLYAYRYKGDPKSYPKVVGPMAQDIEKAQPGTTRRTGRGMLAVDLSRVETRGHA